MTTVLRLKIATIAVAFTAVGAAFYLWLGAGEVYCQDLYMAKFDAAKSVCHGGKALNGGTATVSAVDLITVASRGFFVLVFIATVAASFVLLALLVRARRRANNAMDSDTYSAPLRAPSSARHRER